LLEIHQEVLLNVFLSKLEVFFTVGISVVFLCEAFWKALSHKISSYLNFIGYVGQTVANLRNVGRGLVLKNLLERQAKLFLTLVEGNIALQLVL